MIKTRFMDLLKISNSLYKEKYINITHPLLIFLYIIFLYINEKKL